MRMNVLIFGAGQTGIQILQNIRHKHNVIGFVDNNLEKKGSIINGIHVLGGIDEIKNVSFDYIYIGTVFWESVNTQLLNAGITKEKIIIDLPDDTNSPVRNSWLSCFSKQFSNTTLAVAEGGVYRGNFAAEINKFFPNSKLHLFDTFEGFDSRDLCIEKKRGRIDFSTSNFRNTSVQIVMQKITFPENVIIHKGYFPESALGIKDDFIFVHLDFDLYKPVYEGLRFFYPQVARNGVILLHDYYHFGLSGVREALLEFEEQLGFTTLKVPIGDNQSLAIIKE